MADEKQKLTQDEFSAAAPKSLGSYAGLTPYLYQQYQTDTGPFEGKAAQSMTVGDVLSGINFADLLASLVQTPTGLYNKSAGPLPNAPPQAEATPVAEQVAAPVATPVQQVLPQLAGMTYLLDEFGKSPSEAYSPKKGKSYQEIV